MEALFYIGLGTAWSLSDLVFISLVEDILMNETSAGNIMRDKNLRLDKTTFLRHMAHHKEYLLLEVTN